MPLATIDFGEMSPKIVVTFSSCRSVVWGRVVVVVVGGVVVVVDVVGDAIVSAAGTASSGSKVAAVVVAGVELDAIQLQTFVQSVTHPSAALFTHLTYFW